MLLRTDPGKGRLNYLSIPRDLRVDVPGHGYDKINAAYQIGGPALAIKTVRGFTDVEVNHVVIVDFDAFTKVIDQVGGVDINVPAPILSNKFDCPLLDPGALRPLAGLALREGQAAHGRAPRPRLLADPREQAQPARERRHAQRAPAAR